MIQKTAGKNKNPIIEITKKEKTYQINVNHRLCKPNKLLSYCTNQLYIQNIWKTWYLETNQYQNTNQVFDTKETPLIT